MSRTPPTVVNVKWQEHDVYVGRPTVWGNPFMLGLNSRREAIRKYEEYMRARLKVEPNLVRRLLEFAGKRLGCHCAPLPCHGDVLVKLFNELTRGESHVQENIPTVGGGSPGRLDPGENGPGRPPARSAETEA